MIRKTREDVDGITAVAEPPKRTPTEIAADAAARSEEMRRAAYREHVTRWRTLVFKIAAGEEPGGDELREVAELAAALRLPAGSLAAHVAAVQAEQTLTANLAAAREKGRAAELRAPEIGRELDEARSRVRSLEAEAAANWYAQSDPAHLGQRLEDHRRNNSLLYGNLDAIAEAAVGREVTL